MSSSGLIYAVIVGAWAAYLVPMWLRRQDELNEARPTERFSTAIRLLSGRAGMERRYAKDQKDLTDLEGSASDDAGDPTGPPAAERSAPVPDAATDKVDVRSFGAPAPTPASTAAERARRSKVLARRRRTTVVLFLCFTVGAVVAGVGGLAFLWAPAVPAALLSAYIVYLRVQEKRRFAFTMDQRRAELAAQRLREGRPHPRPAAESPTIADAPADPAAQPRTEPDAPPPPAPSVHAAGRRALVEQTDHAEWVDQQRERGRGGAGESWEPVPVPLPTYVTAPVAPRASGSVDLGAPDTWSSARSSPAEPAPEQPEEQPAPEPQRSPRARRRTRDRGRTPLFDQYADDDRPRAANE
ncbi:hypothetical protein AB0I22_15520 [Streptomyces sp. NPDC050610]|uniref:divisome protein SepX/GlpR n=1 Tax=Streptomyces sp. NPDC050610 TaxID=3157097 RepID=UPI003431A636